MAGELGGEMKQPAARRAGRAEAWPADELERQCPVRVTLNFRSGPDKAGFLKYERVGFPLVYLPARIFADPHGPPYEITLNGPGLRDRPI